MAKLNSSGGQFVTNMQGYCVRLLGCCSDVAVLGIFL